MNVLRKIIKHILLKEFGRNAHTINTNPITFKDFQDYEVEIFPNSRDGFLVNISFKGKSISEFANFKSQEEANHYARNIVDNHRVKFMNSFK